MTRTAAADCILHLVLKDGYTGLTEPGLAAVRTVLANFGVAMRDLKAEGRPGVTRLVIPSGKFNAVYTALFQEPCRSVVKEIARK